MTPTVEDVTSPKVESGKEVGDVPPMKLYTVAYQSDNDTEARRIGAVNINHAFQTAEELARSGATLTSITGPDGAVIADAAALAHLPRKTVTVQEAAKIVGLKPITIRWYARNDRVLHPDTRTPIDKVGNEWAIPLDDDGRPVLARGDLSRGGPRYRW